MFLNADQLAAASGRKRPDAQLRWALERGFVPDERMTDADGRPLVPVALFEWYKALTEPRKVEPNFRALHGT